MYPILFELGFIVIPSWHFFYMIAAISVLFLYTRFGPEWHPSVKPDFWYFSWMAGYSGGYLGARVGSAFFEQNLRISNSLFIDLLSPGPMMLYGGLIGAVLSVSILSFFYKVSLIRVADVAAPCGMFGLAIGRIGCFLNGDDYGVGFLSEPLPFWAVTFPNHAQPVPRVPVQLFESLLCFGIFFSYLFLRKKNLMSRPGMGGLYGFGAYSLGRFFLEFWRDDYRGPQFFNLFSPSQMISLFILTFCGCLLIFIQKKFPVKEF